MLDYAWGAQLNPTKRCCPYSLLTFHLLNVLTVCPPDCGCSEGLDAFRFSRAMRGAEGTTWDGIPSESPPQAEFFLSFTITKMGWESLSLIMVMRWDGKHEEMH